MSRRCWPTPLQLNYYFLAHYVLNKNIPGASQQSAGLRPQVPGVSGRPTAINYFPVLPWLISLQYAFVFYGPNIALH